MKKIIVFALFALSVSAQAFAGDNITMTGDLSSTSSKSGLTVYGAKVSGAAAGATTSTLIGKTSTGVSVGAKTGSTGYALITQHKSGNRAFAASFNSTSVYFKDVTVGTATLTVPSTTDDTSFSSWSSM